LINEVEGLVFVSDCGFVQPYRKLAREINT